MAIEQQQLEVIAATIDDPLAPELAGRLRSQFPGISFTACADDDIIGAAPAVQMQRFNLYLVDASAHCMRLTRDPEAASGVVVAWKDDEA